MNVKIHNVAQLVETIKQAETEEEKIEIIKQQANPVIPFLISINNGHLKMTVENVDKTDWKENPISYEQSDARLISLIKNMDVLFSDSPNLNREKQREFFIRILNRLSSGEANLLFDAFKGKLDVGIDKDLLRKLFPQIHQHLKEKEEIPKKRRGRPKKKKD